MSRSLAPLVPPQRGAAVQGLSKAEPAIQRSASSWLPGDKRAAAPCQGRQTGCRGQRGPARALELLRPAPAHRVHSGRMAHPISQSSSRIAAAFPGGGEMGARIRAFDWSKSPLGAFEQWPQSLCTALSIALDSRYPMAIWWGPDLVVIYNDAWRPLIGLDKAAVALGRPGREVFAEAWSIIGPQLRTVLHTGEATYFDDLYIGLLRAGYLEECYFTYSYSALRVGGNRVGGVFTAVVDTTSRVMAARRDKTIHALGKPSSERSEAQQCRAAMESLASNRHDLPFALLYLLAADGQQATLAGHMGLAEGQEAPAQTTLPDLAEQGWIPPVAELTVAPVTYPAPSAQRLQHDVWGAAPSTAACALIQTPRSSQPVALLIVGISSQQRFCAAFGDFLTRVAESVGTMLSYARAYEDERQRAEKLSEVDRAKTIFFSNASHEFRTPLTLMLAPIEDALDGPDQALAGPALALVHRSGLRLLKLVNRLLDFSRIEAGRVQAHLEPVELGQFTQDLAAAFRAACQRAGVALVVRCPPLDAPVEVDREMWEKIVLNLVSNAFKYTLAGTIEVALARDDSRVVFTVADTGIGISADNLGHIFERFYRAENVHGRSQEGTGIGLALVQELVRFHGGTIEAHSREGVGTTVKVTIPGTRSTAASAPGGPAGGARGQGRASNVAMYVEEATRWLPAGRRQPDLAPQPEAPASAARVLIADDNNDMRDYLARLLSAHYRIDLAEDGLVAHQQAQQHPPDLVLTDVMMPRLDGFGLVAALRAHPATAEIPVVMLSARAGEEARVEGLGAGVDDYLIKPFSARELIARVQASLRVAATRREAKEAMQRVNQQLEGRVQQRTMQLERRLAERDVLLREIHHRVKNNLQVVIALLRLQSRGMAQSAETAALRQCESRLHAMSLVHERLYGAQNHTIIVFSQYVRELVADIFASFALAPGRVEVCLRLAEESIDVGSAIPCGLILNELVTNALKHAFPADRGGQVTVEFLALPDRCWQLVVQDDGVGLPDGFNLHATASIGMQLVSALAGQLDATLDAGAGAGGAGARFVIAFKTS